MSSKDTYILLHKAKGNVGDLFIIERATRLLERVRPDRKFEIWDREIPFGEEQLERLAESAALILTGGPGYQHAAYPMVYPLHPDLDRIQTPIFAFGLGWKAPRGDWAEVASYRWTEETSQLLARLERNSAPSSCRDRLTVAALQENGFTNHVMTGCPTWYQANEAEFQSPTRSRLRIAYTPGALNVKSKAYLRTDLKTLDTVKAFDAGDVTVMFHHPTDQAAFEKYYTPRAWRRYSANLTPYLKHLQKKRIEYRDLSADLDLMNSTYANFDFHVGFRVHAHLHFLSHGKPSVLLAEDGRGRGVMDALPALGFAMSDLVKEPSIGPLRAVSLDKGAFQGFTAAVRSEIAEDYPRSRLAVETINQTYPTMKTFLEGLP